MTARNERRLRWNRSPRSTAIRALRCNHICDWSRSDFPVDELVLNLHKGEKRQTSEAGVRHEEEEQAPAKLPPLRRKETWLAAHRVDFSVYYLRLRRDEFLTLAAIQDGVPLAQAIETGVTSSRVPSGRRPQLVREWFTSWSELGWICAPDIEALHS